MSLVWLPDLPLCLVLIFLWLTRPKEIKWLWNLTSLLRPRVSGFNPWTSAVILIPSLLAVSETAQSLVQGRISRRQTEAEVSFPDHVFIVSIHQDSPWQKLGPGLCGPCSGQLCLSFCCSALVPFTPLLKLWNCCLSSGITKAVVTEPLISLSLWICWYHQDSCREVFMLPEWYRSTAHLSPPA